MDALSYFIFVGKRLFLASTDFMQGALLLVQDGSFSEQENKLQQAG